MQRVFDESPSLVGPEQLAEWAAELSEYRSPLGIFSQCQLCGGGLIPEHAHYRCPSCGWRDSCCD